MPVSRIPNPMTLFNGAAAQVLATIAAHARMKRLVVYGWPGAR
jgi:hypothetical protein